MTLRITNRLAAAAAVLVLLATAGLLAGCGDEGDADAPGGDDAVASSPEPPRGARYDIAGTVEQLTVDSGISAQEQGIVGSMLVVADAGDTTSAYDKASVTITTDTRIWRPVGEGAEDLTVEDLRQGDRVIVEFTGPVAESYPVQATAASVEVVPGS